MLVTHALDLVRQVCDRGGDARPRRGARDRRAGRRRPHAPAPVAERRPDVRSRGGDPGGGDLRGRARVRRRPAGHRAPRRGDDDHGGPARGRRGPRRGGIVRRGVRLVESACARRQDVAPRGQPRSRRREEAGPVPDPSGALGERRLLRERRPGLARRTAVPRADAALSVDGPRRRRRRARRSRSEPTVEVEDL